MVIIDYKHFGNYLLTSILLTLSLPVWNGLERRDRV
jgi:hypothetical protein